MKHHPRLQVRLGLDPGGSRIENRYARFHPSGEDILSEKSIGPRQLGLGVHAQPAMGLGGLEGERRSILSVEQREEVGEVILPLCIV